MDTPTFHMVNGVPTPTGPFCHAAEIDGWVFLTGQTPLDAHDASAPIPEGIEAQTHLVLQHLKTVLSELGLGFEHVVRVGVYLTHLDEDFAQFNAVYKTYFPSGGTARPHLRRGVEPGAGATGGNRLCGAATVLERCACPHPKSLSRGERDFEIVLSVCALI